MSINAFTEKKTQAVPVKKARPRSFAVISGLVVVSLLTFWWLTPIRKSPDTINHPIVMTADLPNFHQVHNYLLRGGAPTPQGLKDLKAMGVKTIIDLRVTPAWLALESQEAHALGMNYVSLPTGNFIPTKDHVQSFLDILNQAANNPSVNGPVFVHCAHGSDRTGFLVALWRVKHDRWSVVDAIKEMLSYGFILHKFSHEKTSLFS